VPSAFFIGDSCAGAGSLLAQVAGLQGLMWFSRFSHSPLQLVLRVGRAQIAIKLTFKGCQ
jgi:hypothetical protein